jgi:hypothetical protein
VPVGPGVVAALFFQACGARGACPGPADGGGAPGYLFNADSYGRTNRGSPLKRAGREVDETVRNQP